MKKDVGAVLIEKLTEDDVRECPELAEMGWSGPGFYFWENMLECHGPYATETDCIDAVDGLTERPIELAVR